MYYLAILETILFWGGLLVFLVSLAMYAGRTKDFKSLIMFWQPTIAYNVVEFKVNRTGLGMMLIAIVIRFAVHFLA
ncbi:hypothetical protein [Neptunomonas concharum]|uniref:Uncharacterized protein n=1 Tax=Neptunomonas concharum TaxID=1031538 RepID=A0A5P1RGE7_9GAMM|nr:hypothetical protein [Neptunomonas concharum]QEQ98211.1 hypothetical protein F0U83_16660 [Neptunomonas concharum]